MIRKSKDIVDELPDPVSQESAVKKAAAPEGWESVRGHRAVMLTTYRRDGSGVSTPVGYGVAEDRLYFMTQPGTHKVGRLARNPRCTLAASTLRGAVKGPARPGVARVLEGPEADQAVRLITAHNRVAWFFLLRGARRQGRSWTIFEVTPATTGERRDG